MHVNPKVAVLHCAFGGTFFMLMCTVIFSVCLLQHCQSLGSLSGERKVTNNLMLLRGESKILNGIKGKGAVINLDRCGFE